MTLVSSYSTGCNFIGYTERYMGLPKENQADYDAASVIKRVDGFPSKYATFFKILIFPVQIGFYFVTAYKTKMCISRTHLHSLMSLTCGGNHIS